MTRHRVTDRSLRIVHPAFAALLVAAVVVSLLPAVMQARSADSNPRGAANSGPTRIFLFNVEEGGSYSVTKNDADFTSVGAGPNGTMSYTDDVSPGDVYKILLTGTNPVDSPIPENLQAVGNDQGCAVLTWDTPNPGFYVYEYMLAWGPSPGTLRAPDGV